MSEAELQVNNGMSGEDLLRDFNLSMGIAIGVSELQSWNIGGSFKSHILDRIKNNPVAAENEIAPQGLSVLLSSYEEQKHLESLVSASKTLNLMRFLGAKATVHAEERGHILGFSVANQHFVGWNGESYIQDSIVWRKTKTAKVVSFHPVRGVVQLARSRGQGRANPFIIGRGMWEVHPFENDETVVNFAIESAS